MTKLKEDPKSEFSRILNQAKAGFKKFGEELGVLAQKSEKEIRKASKLGKIQLDIMSLSVQKEKLYYDIGKRTATINAKRNLDIPELEPCWRKMSKLEEDARRKKETLAHVRKIQKIEKKV